jgi:HEPN domain-containing protein
VTQQKPIDPLATFLNAERFKAAAACLSMLLRQQDWRELFIPMHVNAAFALELYLKALLILNGKDVPQAHHHGHLFRALSKPICAPIAKRFAAYSKNDEELLWMAKQDARYSGDLESILDDSGDVFKTLRYIHRDGLPSKMRFSPNITLRFFRDELIALQPSWEASSNVIEAAHMPLSLNESTSLETRVSPVGIKSIINPPPSNPE